MATTTISALPAYAPASAATNLILPLDDPADTTTKRMTVSQLHNTPTFAGQVTVGGTVPFVNITGPAGVIRGVEIQTAGAGRWRIFADSAAESGGSQGSSLNIQGFDDSLGYGTVIALARANPGGVAGVTISRSV